MGLFCLSRTTMAVGDSETLVLPNAAVVCVSQVLRRWTRAAPLTSGALQSMQRYVVAIPAIFIALAGLGRSATFDRSWTLVSLLWMGLLVTLYAFDFWTA